MNRVGIIESKRMVEKYCKLSNQEIPQCLQRDTPFHFSWVDREIRNRIATITINRPEAMNALNEAVVAQLSEVVEEINQSDDVDVIVIDGAGKAFVAGADVKFFVDKIRAEAIPEIYEFTAQGHQLLNMIESSEKTTIALTTGLALGGGLELALSCDYRIGTRRTSFRFPETSIGIYPGLEVLNALHGFVAFLPLGMPYWLEIMSIHRQQWTLVSLRIWLIRMKLIRRLRIFNRLVNPKKNILRNPRIQNLL